MSEISHITSPRKLQEMTLPAEGHDITSISGVSMKQYEEQLIGLRKENFNLKLRVYFLEEKLGSGYPPAVQGLLEHNVRLQVEVEELMRQLADKQELLSVAAEAIEELGQKGSISTDSVEASMTNINLTRRGDMEPQEFNRKEEIADDTCAESESACELVASGNNEEVEELVKLRRQNRKALQMIKGCMKKIQQQDKQIKMLKLDKELAYAHVSDSQLVKYEEILKCKDEHIKDLENKVKELQTNAECLQNDDSAGNLQQLLTKRLQGLAYFLDKLLSHKCVLGEEKKKLAESILEQSLALPVGLKLDESMAPEEFTMDESNIDMSQSFRIEDLTLMFGHHASCGEHSKRYSKRPIKSFPQADVMSESECWSEPDRKVSLARVGLCDTGVSTRESVSDNNKYRSRRSRISYGSRSDDNKVTSENVLQEEFDQIVKRCEQLEDDKNDLNCKLEFAQTQIDNLLSEKKELKQTLSIEQAKIAELVNNSETLKTTLLTMESRYKDIELQLSNAYQVTEKLRSERQELESAFLETERSLRRAADEATVQASQAALERARAQHERLRVERELEETREKLSTVMDANAQLEIEITKRAATVEVNNKIAVINEGLLNSEDDRPPSPDQGIDSDRLSSLEQTDAVALSPRSLYEENVTLKQKLARTKATLAETLAQLNASNLRKKSVQIAICREIHKTHGVLRRARDQFENHNNE